MGYGRGYGRGYGFGRGFGWGLGPNLGWNCRFFPNLPRRWWMMPPEMLAQFQEQFAQNPVSTPVTGFEGYQGPYGPAFPTMTKEQEIQMLENQTEFLKVQLEQIQNRLQSLRGGE